MSTNFTQPAYPSLSGWVTESNQTLDLLFASFLASNYSQSVLFHGGVSSLQYCIYKDGNDFNNLQNTVTVTLENLLGRYFPSVNVNVDIRKDDVLPQYSMYISARVTDHDNKILDMAKSFDIVDSKTIRMFNLNNTGV